MSSSVSCPCQSMENPAILSSLQQTSGDRRSKTGWLFRMFKLFPLLSSGCNMVAILGQPHKTLLTNGTTTGTLFGYRKGRVNLAIQENPKFAPSFVIELPLLTKALHKEMASGSVRIALDSKTRNHKKKLLEELVWAVYCNGRKIGYSIRSKQTSEEELHVMQLLRGVSMGAGVVDGELTYMRARFERVVGSKDSEAFYMVNLDGTGGPELSIFFVRI